MNQRMAILRAKSWTLDLPSVNQNWYPLDNEFESERAAASVHCWKVFNQCDLLIYNYVYISITILWKQTRENGNRNF